MHGMKKIIVVLFGSLVFIQSYSQLFQAVDTIRLAGVADAYGNWADLDNNANYDFVLFVAGNNDEAVTGVKYSFETGFLDTLALDFLTSVRFELADVDNDTQLDIIATTRDGSQRYLSVFYQAGVVEFSAPEVVAAASAEQVRVIDLDNDGQKEILFSTRENELFIKSRRGSAWEDHQPALEIIPGGDWIVYDADNDGWQDLFVNGGNAGQLMSRFYRNRQGRLFEASDSSFAEAMNGELLKADFNGDGKFDLVTLGYNAGGQFFVSIQLDTGQWVIESALDLEGPQGFAADLNSDGLCDLVVSGNDPMGQMISRAYLNQSSETLVVEDISLSLPYLLDKFADTDYDGDLDRMVITQQADTLVLTIQSNATPAENFDPGIVENHVAFPIHGGIVLAWEGAVDDHTTPASLTYDVTIGSSAFKAEDLAGNFDLVNTKRLLAVRGNAGFREEMLTRRLEAGEYHYTIQTIDNALYYPGNKQGAGGDPLPCDGRALACGTFTVCEDIQEEPIPVCGDEVIVLSSDQPTGWYSMNKGFLGISASIHYEVTQPDTVYANPPGNTVCPGAKAFIIYPLEEQLLALRDTTACKGTTLAYHIIMADADSITWTSSVRGVLSYQPTLAYTAGTDDQIKVEIFHNSCLAVDSFLVEVSEPSLELPKADYRIIRGESIQLSASGGIRYSWEPASSLDGPLTSSPIAYPEATTGYTVTAYDSIGCSATGSVRVIVVDVGWVPNLFTPNDDGVNDRLRVYGLEQAADFSFTVYNRPGNVVYQSNDVFEATRDGWDGTVNGISQPNGVYYWKVAGTLDDGSDLLLNNKDSGVIYLMR